MPEGRTRGEVERERKEKPPSPHPLSPEGDTPCVTAGDARRANPWRELHSSLRHQRCRTAPTFTYISLYSLNAFSATPPASESSLYPHGFTLATARASPAESGEGEKREASQSALTVPRGDTPCVTAGDARRANPWRSGEGEKRETSQPAPTVPGGGHTMRNRG